MQTLRQRGPCLFYTLYVQCLIRVRPGGAHFGPWPSPAHSLFLNGSQLRMVFTFFKRCLKERRKKENKEEHMTQTICSPQSLNLPIMALLRKCSLTPVLDPPIIVTSEGREGRGEGTLKNGEGQTEICNKYNW